MSRRDLSQPSFVDAMVSGYGKVGGFLDRIGKRFDWSAFEVLLSPIHGSAMGAPGYPPLTMFKILLLQQWHTLSDPAAVTAGREPLAPAASVQGRRPALPRRLRRPLHQQSRPKQALRMMKVKMKISGAFRTFGAAQDFAMLRSVIATARKRGWNILQTLTRDAPSLINALPA